MPSVQNVLTVDLEEWFVAQALSGRADSWEKLPSTVERNCDRLLSLFYNRRVSSTWFVLGWVAERFPNLIRVVAEAGHEIACHSYKHRRVDQLTPEEFKQDTTKAIEAISSAVGFRPLGYRAPSWSINDSVPWAFEVLANLDFEYDSSIFPIKHDIYGMPSGPRELFRMSFDNNRYLYEIPASTHRFLGRNFPIGGGGYLRHSPYWYSRMMIRSLNRSGKPAIVYIHPWEIDPEPPRLEGLSMIQRFRSYSSTDILHLKLERLLNDFEFTTMIDYVRETTRNRIGFERVRPDNH